MAEQNTQQVAPRNRAQRTKLTLADFGAVTLKGMDPAKLAEMGGKLNMGRFIGIAVGFVERNAPDGNQKFEGLKGQFRIIPADHTKEELESGVCFFPDAYHNLLAGPLRAAIGGGNGAAVDPNATVQFGFQVNAIPAKNPAGYSWEFVPLIASTGVNPLDDLYAGILKIAPPAPQKAIASGAGKSR